MLASLTSFATRRWKVLSSILFALVAFVLFADFIGRLDGWLFAAPALLQLGFGWSPPLLFLQSLGVAIGTMGHFSLPPDRLLLGAIALIGLAAVALGIHLHAPPAPPRTPSGAVGAPLYPRLAAYRDFYWTTLAAYGFGIFAAEGAMVVLQMVLAGGVDISGQVTRDEGPFAMSPVGAFAVAGLVAAAIAFAAGFLGAMRARRISLPEATIGILYLGLPIPLALTVIAANPELELRYSQSLREVLYVASLIGRPEAAFWLVFAGLLLVMLIGITAGFVATGSGQLDLRTGTELFIAGRHVSIFRPRLLLGGLAVLLFGIIPPLLIFAVLKAADLAVDRTRIKQLGQRDPLEAAGALNAAKSREQSPTAMMTSLAVGGVGVGVMALIIVLSVMSGFEEDLQKKILGTNAHIMVSKYSDFSEGELDQTRDKVKHIAGITGATPFILNQVMVSAEGNMDGSIIKGIDPATVGEVTDLPQNILPGGKLEWLEHPEQILEKRLAPKGGAAVDGDPVDGKTFKRDPELLRDDDIIGKPAPRSEGKPATLPGIIVGKELAQNLKVIVGDRVNVVTPSSDELGPSGPIPKTRPFRVAAIFYSGMYEYDSKMVYIHFKEAMSFFKGAGVVGLEVKVADVDDARRLSSTILHALGGYPFRTKDWGEMNHNLFSALRLEKLVMAIILSIIVIVAAGLIVATVIMLVLEKRKEISVLKALGVSDGGILKIFLAEGLQIGVAGSLLGLVAGLAWCKFIERVGIKLDPEVYYIPALPVKIVPLQTAIPVVIAVLVSFLASVYPALKASRVEPVEGLKAE